jgi:hypothetical protein
MPLNVNKLTGISVNATDEDTIIGAALGSGKITQQALDNANPTQIIHGYGDTTVTANTWTDCAITWNEDLTPGTYEVVGMRAGIFLAANLWSGLMRLVIPGQSDWRPGVPCVLMEADHEEYQSVTFEPYAHWPIMGVTFTDNNMPNVEVCSSSAVTDENVELMIQKVG